MMHKQVEQAVLAAATELLEQYFSEPVVIGAVTYISQRDRGNTVLRIGLVGSKKLPHSIILKQSLANEEDGNEVKAVTWWLARDWASLEYLNGITHYAHNVPKFYGASKEHRFILIEDLGEKHISLVDALTVPDKDNGIAALARFMSALGIFHAASFGTTHDYWKILRDINPQAKTWEDDLTSTTDDLLAKLEIAHKLFGFTITSAMINETKVVIHSMIVPGLFTALIHGDICPDNVFDYNDARGLQLIDFESAIVRNALLDGTYLRMSMPTCWCAKAIPVEIIDSLEGIYREELQKVLLAARDDKTYHTAYTHACAFWMLDTMKLLDGPWSRIWFEEYTWPSGPVPGNSQWKANENLTRPRFLSRLSAFIGVATKYDLLPHLKEMAVLMLNLAKKQWPDAKQLDVYPAFRQPSKDC